MSENLFEEIDSKILVCKVCKEVFAPQCKNDWNIEFAAKNHAIQHANRKKYKDAYLSFHESKQTPYSLWKVKPHKYELFGFKEFVYYIYYIESEAEFDVMCDYYYGNDKDGFDVHPSDRYDNLGNRIYDEDLEMDDDKYPYGKGYYGEGYYVAIVPEPSYYRESSSDENPRAIKKPFPTSYLVEEFEKEIAEKTEFINKIKQKCIGTIKECDK